METNASTIETDTSFNPNPAEVTTDISGTAKFENLPIGIYEIEETSMPAGYVLAGFKGKAYVKITTTGMSLLKKESGKAPQEWITLSTGDQDSDYLVLTAETLTVKNEPGAALPSTGGVGTAGYTLIGMITMLCAAAYLLTRRAKER